MDRERRERQKSIRAARTWLTGAEDALAGEDDLAGDLKLMLARAELARIAAHRRARLRRWAGWLVPPIAAAAVWAWIAWESPSPQEETQPFPVRAAQEHGCCCACTAAGRDISGGDRRAICGILFFDAGTRDRGRRSRSAAK